MSEKYGGTMKGKFVLVRFGYTSSHTGINLTLVTGVTLRPGRGTSIKREFLTAGFFPRVLFLGRQGPARGLFLFCWFSERLSTHLPIVCLIRKCLIGKMSPCIPKYTPAV
jgi:hypothetical protein